jgi:bacteriorhodopsin
MRQLVMTVLVLGMVLPPVFVGAAAYRWWPSLQYRWLFVGVGLAAIYALSAYLMLRQFPHIELANRPANVDAHHSMVRWQSISALAQLTFGSAAIL